MLHTSGEPSNVSFDARADLFFRQMGLVAGARRMMMPADFNADDRRALVEGQRALREECRGKEPKPGVTVMIGHRLAIEYEPRRELYHWDARLDGASTFQFAMYGDHDEQHKPFLTPEAAKADCRKHLNALIGLLAGSAIAIGLAHGMAWDLENIKFVEE